MQIDRYIFCCWQGSPLSQELIHNTLFDRNFDVLYVFISDYNLHTRNSIVKYRVGQNPYLSLRHLCLLS